MQRKRILAAVMSLCMVAGVASYGAPVISQTITAQAEAATEAECYSFDEETGVLTLRGEIDGDALREFNSINREKVNSVVAEEGTILPEDSSELFYRYISCNSIDLSNADTSKVTNMSYMFTSCYDLTSLDLSKFDTSKVTDMHGMFANCYSLTSLDVSAFDTSKVTNMSYMFSCCYDLTSLDVSIFDTSNVTDMRGMFANCDSLTSLDVSAFDTSNVINMNDMFGSCINLTSLDLSKFDTSKVTNMSSMFRHCQKLTTLDVSRFNTSKVTDMPCMFNGCKKLQSLDVSGFDTSNVTDMKWMFSDCSGLTSLDLSSFDTSNVTDMVDMFRNCDNLKSLTLGENFKNVPEEAMLNNGKGWVNMNSPATIVSGNGDYAVIENNGKNTYKLFGTATENKPTYPTNIKVAYSATYHQVRFTWDKVEGADRYGIAVYLAGKWRVQAQDITDTTYTTPKNLTPGKTYKVAVAARVDGKWYTSDAIKNAVDVTIK